jgi:H2-forming N5,N10-methylenetetrahydromethanopterin dehydrogenase-like enzyme
MAYLKLRKYQFPNPNKGLQTLKKFICVLVVCCSLLVSSAHSAEGKGFIVLPEIGNRKIIELDKKQNLSEKNISNTEKPEIKKTEEIELIIGGQSTDGIAKRVLLKLYN